MVLTRGIKFLFWKTTAHFIDYDALYFKFIVFLQCDLWKKTFSRYSILKNTSSRKYWSGNLI